LTPGVVNAINSYYKLDRDCSRLPFFNPWKASGFWLWLTLQVSLPSLIFYWKFSSSDISAEAWFRAVGFGLGFIALLNSTTQFGSLNINIKFLYDLFVRFAYSIIDNHERSRSASFWSELEHELEGCNDTGINAGLGYLREYILADITPEVHTPTAIKKRNQKSSVQDSIKEVEAIQSKYLAQHYSDKASSIVGLIKQNVKRRDLLAMLQKFGCSKTYDSYHMILPNPHRTSKISRNLRGFS
jgi:hypothetical protein